MRFMLFAPGKQLEKRKGGKGGGGGGGHSSGSSGEGGSSGTGNSGKTGGSSSDSGGSSSGSPNSGSKGSPSGNSGASSKFSPSNPGPRIPVKNSGKKSSVQSYGNGVAKTSVIPAGQLFAGRTVGGGIRANIFGTRRYGSGYPGISTPGVRGRSFPFGFWPFTFGAAAGAGISSRDLHDNEYGDPNNSSRPGGPLYEAPFVNGSSTYRVLADNITVSSLITSITSNCSLSTTNITASPFNPSNPNQSPTPEQVIQYYRASSIALSLDGYNNSAVFSSNDSAPDTPLPSNLDLSFLNCLNQTIGAAAPLLDGAPSMYTQRFHGFYVILILFVYMLQ